MPARLAAAKARKQRQERREIELQERYKELLDLQRDSA